MFNPDKLKNAKTVSFPKELSRADIAIAKLKADLAVHVFNHREAAGLTQAQFAKQYGISQSTVSKIENGDDGLSLKSIFEVATALGFELQLEKHESSASSTVSNVIHLSSYRNNRGVVSRASKDNRFRGASYSLLEDERKEM